MLRIFSVCLIILFVAGCTTLPKENLTLNNNYQFNLEAEPNGDVDFKNENMNVDDFSVFEERLATLQEKIFELYDEFNEWLIYIEINNKEVWEQVVLHNNPAYYDTDMFKQVLAYNYELDLLIYDVLAHLSEHPDQFPEECSVIADIHRPHCPQGDFIEIYIRYFRNLLNEIFLPNRG